MISTNAVHHCVHCVIWHLDRPRREPAQRCGTIFLEEEALEEIDEVKEGVEGGVLDIEQEVLGKVGRPRT
jgi:hypothetical protein